MIQRALSILLYRSFLFWITLQWLFFQVKLENDNKMIA